MLNFLCKCFMYMKNENKSNNIYKYTEMRDQWGNYFWLPLTKYGSGNLALCSEKQWVYSFYLIHKMSLLPTRNTSIFKHCIQYGSCSCNIITRQIHHRKVVSCPSPRHGMNSSVDWVMGTITPVSTLYPSYGDVLGSFASFIKSSSNRQQ